MTAGGCLCQAVRFTIDAAPMAARACWCRLCQYLGAGNATVNVIFPADALSVDGAVSWHEATADSGNHMRRGFCPQCGAPLYSASTGEEPKSYTVRVGSIRQSELFVPTQQIWCRSTLPWLDQGLAAPKADKNA